MIRRGLQGRRFAQPAALVEHPSLAHRFLITDCPSADVEALEGEFVPVLVDHGVSVVVRLCDSSAYDKSVVEARGIVVRDDMAFDDGSTPSKTILDTYRAMLDDLLLLASTASSSPRSDDFGGDDAGSSPTTMSTGSLGRASEAGSVGSVTRRAGLLVARERETRGSLGSVGGGKSVSRVSTTTTSSTTTTTTNVRKPTVAVHCVSGIGRAPVLVAVALIDSGVDPLEAVEIVRQKRRGALNKVQLEWLTTTTPKGGFVRRRREEGPSGGVNGGVGKSMSWAKGLFKKRSGAVAAK